MSRSNSNESQLFDIGHSTNVKMIRVECHCFMIDKVKDKFMQVGMKVKVQPKVRWHLKEKSKTK